MVVILTPSPVILNEVKNLIESIIGQKTEILRLTPQNDITTQSPWREGGFLDSSDKSAWVQNSPWIDLFLDSAHHESITSRLPPRGDFLFNR
jgi:hypothetical protein